MVAGLAEGAGHQGDAPGPQVRQGPGAVLVPVGDLERQPVAGAGDPVAPALLAQAAQHVAGALVALAEPRADQHAPAEAELFQVRLDVGEVLVAEFLVQHPEQLPEALGLEHPGLGPGRVAQVSEVAGEELQDLDRPVQDHLGGVAEEQPVVDLLLPLDGRDGQRVQVPDHLRVGQAVGQHALPVADRGRVGEAGQDRGAGHVEEILVARGHGPQQRGQLQILDQRVRLRGQLRLRVEVPVGVHEVDFHAIRSFTRS